METETEPVVMALPTLRELVARLSRLAAGAFDMKRDDDDDGREGEGDGEGLMNLEATNNDDDESGNLGILVNEEGFLMPVVTPVVMPLVLLMPVVLLVKQRLDMNVGRIRMCCTKRRILTATITPLNVCVASN